MSNTIVEKAYDYRQLPIPQELLHATVTKKEIQEQVRKAASLFTTFETVHIICNGDIVALQIPDEACADGWRIEYVNVGRNFFPGEEQLIGKIAGEDILLPYGGKTVRAKVAQIKRKSIPQLTDEMIVKLNIEGISSVAEYEERAFHFLAKKKRNRNLNGIWSFASRETVAHSVLLPVTPENECFRTLYALNMRQMESIAQRIGQSVERAMAVALQMLDKTAEECYQKLHDLTVESVQQCALGKQYAIQNGMDFADANMTDEESIHRFIAYFKQAICDYYEVKITVAME